MLSSKPIAWKLIFAEVQCNRNAPAWSEEVANFVEKCEFIISRM